MGPTFFRVVQVNGGIEVGERVSRVPSNRGARFRRRRRRPRARLGRRLGRASRRLRPGRKQRSEDVLQQRPAVLRRLRQDLCRHPHAPLAQAVEEAQQQPLLVFRHREARQALARQAGEGPERKHESSKVLIRNPMV